MSRYPIRVPMIQRKPIDLLHKKCIPCEGGTPAFKKEQVKEYLSQLQTAWEVIDGRKIKREFLFKSFKEAIGFVNKVADIAEQEGHHPDIYVYYTKVQLVLWTHAIGGLSENDFIMARKIENLLF